MNENVLLGIGIIISCGIFSQWIAWRFHLPAILILLVAGFWVGPVTGLLDPDAVLGDTLFPFLSISVAIILFEGGLNLRFSELKGIGSEVRNLVSIGVIVTFGLSYITAIYLFDFGYRLTLLFASILVVTGPTVIIPLLRHLRLSGRIDSLVKWEGIVNDPIGAILAVLIFETILLGDMQSAGQHILIGFIKTTGIGLVAGTAGAGSMILLLRRYWVPDFLRSPMMLMIVIIVTIGSNYFQHESALLSVTLMGIILANQKYTKVESIIEFKENLTVLLISSLFIIIAARLKVEELQVIDLNAFIFLAILILIIRPAAVFLSLFRSEINIKEKLFLSFLAPRGIVAAAIVSVFAFELSSFGYAQAEFLTPVTLFVIVSTVIIYGFAATFLARFLELSSPNPQGVIFVGAHSWAQEIALALQKENFNVAVTDTNWDNISEARMRGIPAYYDNVLSEHIFETVAMDGIGKLLALTSNDGVNNLACLHFQKHFETSGVFQLAAKERKIAISEKISESLQGRVLFGKDLTYNFLENLFAENAEIKATVLTQEFDYDSFTAHHDEKAIPLFVITESRELKVVAVDSSEKPVPGDTLISIV